MAARGIALNRFSAAFLDILGLTYVAEWLSVVSAHLAWAHGHRFNFF